MKKLNITKEAFEKSKYFTNKYGKLEYVSESGKVFKTDKGKILMFKESKESLDEYLRNKDFNALDSNLWSGGQGCCGSNLGYEDLDDYWR
jgi:hypothetical protein